MDFNLDTLAAAGAPADLGDKVWVDVLEAVDKTYAELVDYQEQLEAQNTELSYLKAFLKSIMLSISDYLVVTERDGRILEASRSFCEVMGAGTEEVTGRNIATFFDGDARAQFTEIMATVTGQRKELRFEADLSTKAGTAPVDFRMAPRLDRRQKSAGVILTGRPLAELRRAYTELEESHEQLKQAQSQLVSNEKLASLGRLLAGVAHELNNPISFVYANTHSLEKYLDRFETYFQAVEAGASREDLIALRQELRLGRDLKNLRVAIEGARDGSERVRDIVEDLRRLSAKGSGEMAVFDFVETSKVAASWVKRGTKSDLEVNIVADGPFMAMGRAGHIQQVVMNLVQNAVDALDGQEGPRICLKFSYQGERAVLDICDNGPGIPSAVQPAIFDPFFTTKEVGKGTGLGLSISHKIAEEHGGTLAYIPDGAEGACFRLSLPRGDRA